LPLPDQLLEIGYGSDRGQIFLADEDAEPIVDGSGQIDEIG
jgi:hypothetical protein